MAHGHAINAIFNTKKQMQAIFLLLKEQWQLDIANNISVPLKTALFCLNLKLITSQNEVNFSISYEMVKNITK